MGPGTSNSAPTVEMTCFRISKLGERVELKYKMDQPVMFCQYMKEFHAVDQDLIIKLTNYLLVRAG